MIIHDGIAQGTSAWLDLRKGIPTCSRFSDIVTPGGAASKSATGYMHHLLAERILGRPIDGFKSAAMEHGNDFEGHAIKAYEFAHDVETRKIGFVTTDDGRVGCSPDSFIEEQPEGMVEAKAPNPATHVGYLLEATGAASNYKVQLQGELWVCEKVWVDIISYCPGMPDAVYRVYRDEEFIGKLASAVRAFSDLLEQRAAEFRERGWIVDPVPVAQPGQDASFISDEDLAWVLNRDYANTAAV